LRLSAPTHPRAGVSASQRQLEPGHERLASIHPCMHAGREERRRRGGGGEMDTVKGSEEQEKERAPGERTGKERRQETTAR
jgi:hypothetical protein